MRNIADDYRFREKPNVYAAAIVMMSDGPTIFGVGPKKGKPFMIPHYYIMEFPELRDKDSEDVIDLGFLIKEKDGSFTYTTGSHAVKFDPEIFVQVDSVSEVAKKAIAAGRVQLKKI